MATSPEADALIVASGFLIATLSVVIVVYRLQWDYFDAKTSDAAKIDAAPRTVFAFVTELAYVLLAASALVVNADALLGGCPVAFALAFSFLVGGVFVVIVGREIGSSIVHIVRREWQNRPHP